MIPFSSIYLWDSSAGAYVNLEFASSDLPGTALALMEQATDRLYMGLDRTFDGIWFDLTVGGVGYTDPADWEIWDGTAWSNLPISINYDFTADGIIRFAIPSSWTTRLLNGVEGSDTNLGADDIASGVSKYWVRVTSAAVPTTVATMRRTFPFPSYAYTTPVDVNAWLQLRTAFSTTTSPTLVEVENVIRKIEGRVEGYSTLAWKPKYRENEFYEYNRWGFTLKRYPVLQLFELSIWNGSAFEILVEGREQDYFVDEPTGIVSFSRLINLPFAYSRSRSWGFGEFRRAIRVSYIWGKDIDFDDRAFMVRDLTTKLVAADLLSNYDFTQLIPQGTDRFALEQKINYWREEGTERLEELRPLRTWTL